MTPDEAAGEIAAGYAAMAPDSWIRVVTWMARLADHEHGPIVSAMEVSRIVVWQADGPGLVQLPGDEATDAASARLTDVEQDSPAEGWTFLRVELDRDGRSRVEFSHDPALVVDTAVLDPYWDDVKHYVDRHREDLDAFVERLRADGSLPSPGDPAQVDPRSLPPSQRRGAEPRSTEPDKGRIGRIFGRR